MTIVPIGNIPLQVPENGTPKYILELVAQMRNLILPMVSRSIEESLETELDRYFGHRRYASRRRSQPKKRGCMQPILQPSASGFLAERA